MLADRLNTAQLETLQIAAGELGSQEEYNITALC